ncbi:MAG: hypothetical protein EOP11_06660 [Proteobacteria bacterium]|nr:MAG: hypothetical protein EOP11_06660 [Pseudomonadota bacterium]
MKKHARIDFEGTIKYVSLSPHGDPEGIVLDDGSFVKAPPHSLVKKELFKVGAKVSGTGEIISEEPHPVLHHAQIKAGSEILSDDSGDEDEREELKEAHKADLKSRPDAKEEKLTLKGRIAAIATKPKGEVDRVILEDGTSIHVSKDMKLTRDDCEIGSMIQVEGKTRLYGVARFMKAEIIKQL